MFKYPQIHYANPSSFSSLSFTNQTIFFTSGGVEGLFVSHLFPPIQTVILLSNFLIREWQDFEQ